MGHLRLSRPFQRFLTLALSDKREPLKLADEIVGSVQVADYSDVAPAHSNPIFGVRTQQAAAGATLHSGVVLIATIRPLRIRQLFVNAGTDVRLRVYQLDDNPMTVVVNIVPETMGPIGTDTPTAIFNRGTAPAPGGAQTGFLPEQAQWNLRPGLLIAPGQLFSAFDLTDNTLVGVALMWEEIPRFGEVTNAGYPGIDD